jgi:hypothetical protein
VAGGGITADISGSVSHSQIAIGKKIAQHNYGPGTTVNHIVTSEIPRPRQRQTRESLLPRDMARLHGRGAEVDSARAAIACGEPIQFCGPPGIGKTALLRHLSHRPSRSFPDGVIYYRSRRESLDDLLMRAFEFFFESDGDTRLKPTSAELERYLGEIEALFLLDDVDLGREDLETLLQTMPRSAFVLGSPARSLFEGQSIRLRGLRQPAAVALVQDRLGRDLSRVEITECAQLSIALDGHPLQLVQAAIRLREERTTPAQLLAQTGAAVTAPSPAHRLTAQIAANLPEPERDVLSLLAALDGTPLHVDHIAALTSQADTPALLADLEKRRLAQSHGHRYFATAPVAALQDSESSNRWRSSLLTYFTDLTERHRSEPERLRDDLEPIIQTLRWGMACAPHAEVLHLAHQSGAIAELAGLWDAWRSILDIALDAARMIGDRAGEGWAQHELGTRALCLEHDDEAAQRLEAALRIREKLGDQPGLAVTWHNLGQLPHVPPPLLPPSDPPWGPAWLTPLCIAGGVAILTAPVIPPLIRGPNHADARPGVVRPGPGSKPTGDRRAPRHPSRGTAGPSRTTVASLTPSTTPPSPSPTTELREGPAAVRGNVKQPVQSHGPTVVGPKGSGSGPGPPGQQLVPVVPSDYGSLPTNPPTECSTGLLAAIINFVRRQGGVLERVVELDLPGGLAAEVDAVRRLLRELFGLDCGRDEIEAQVRRVAATAG